jgi:hypothetical protein
MQAHDKFLRLAMDGMLLAHTQLLGKMCELQKLAQRYCGLAERLLRSQEQQQEGGSGSRRGTDDSMDFGHAERSDMAVAMDSAEELAGLYDVQLGELLELLRVSVCGAAQGSACASCSACIACTWCDGCVELSAPGADGCLAAACVVGIVHSAACLYSYCGHAVQQSTAVAMP